MNLRSYFPMALVAVPAAAFTFTPPAVAQGFTEAIKGRGMASITPAGVLLKNAGVNSRVLLKLRKDQGAPPAAWSYLTGPPQPDYSLASLYSVYELYGGLELDAISTGNATIPRHSGDGLPVLNIPSGAQSWMGVTVSVANGNQGVDGSHFDEADESGQETGGELATHYLADSVGLSSAITGKTLLETSRVHFGLGASSSDDIVGLDYAIGVIRNDPSELAGAFFSNRSEIYFSLTAPSANDIAGLYGNFATDLGGTTPMFLPHAGDIYRSTWDKTDEEWGTPELYLSHSTLGLLAVGDIDALEIDPFNETVIFSAVGVESFDPLKVTEPSQLMIYQTGHESKKLMGNPNDGVDKLTGGVPDIAGDNPHEIDSVCVLDPEVGQFGTLIGTPFGYRAEFGSPMGISLVRGQHSNGADRLTIQITGWGDALPADCNVSLYRKVFPNPNLIDPAVDLSGWSYIAGRARTSAQDKIYFARPGGLGNGRTAGYLAIARVGGVGVIAASHLSIIVE